MKSYKIDHARIGTPSISIVAFVCACLALIGQISQVLGQQETIVVPEEFTAKEGPTAIAEPF